MESLEGLLTPSGTRIVHIGPHKTGTTAIQASFHRQRSQVAEQGVHYVGTSAQAYHQALGLTSKTGRKGTDAPQDEWWTDCVTEIEAAGDMRVVMSSESFANAETEHIARLRADLDPDRVHIVRMIRRYDKLIPSQWQQSIVAGRTTNFDRWTNAVMTDPDRPFWDRHHFARLTRRWSDVVGADRTTVVVVNEHDHDWLCRVFEQLVGLRAGTLQVPAQRTNRSLNLGEVELLRQLNGVLKRYEWNGRTHLTFVRQGVSPGLKRAPADPHAGRIRSGADVDLLADLQRQHYAELEALGVEIVGRQEWLDLPAPSASDRAEAEQDPSLSMESAVAGVMGAIESTQAMGRFPLDGTPPAELLRPPAVSAGDGAVRSAATLLDALEAACATHGWDPADVRRHLAGARLGAQAALGEGRWTKVTDPDRSVPDGRISPRLVAGVIGGVIASSDPAAEPATPSPLPSRSRSLRGAWRRGR